MENSVSANTRVPAIINNPSSSSDAVIQSDEANPNSSASSDVKARQFADMLDKQQQVTALGIKYETTVFDAAQDVEINATYSEPAKAAQL